MARKTGRRPVAKNVPGLIARSRVELQKAVLRDMVPEGAGRVWRWHYGTINHLGIGTSGRVVEITWDEGIQAHGGEPPISDESWEILKLAWATTRRVRTLSLLPDNEWVFAFTYVWTAD